MKNLHGFNNFDKINESNKPVELVVGSRYKVIKELNGENQQFPNDYDFEPDTELIIDSFDKSEHTVIAYEDRDIDELWGFDYDTFIESTTLI